MKALCDFLDHKRAWQSDFDQVVPTAVDEIVARPVIFMHRTATEDTEIGGQKIRADDKLMLRYASGNRDEAVFSTPCRFDVRRDPDEHIGFGGGPHYGPGANLARREIT
jgi:cytochrome P450